MTAYTEVCRETDSHLGCGVKTKQPLGNNEREEFLQVGTH